MGGVGASLYSPSSGVGVVSTCPTGHFSERIFRKEIGMIIIIIQKLQLHQKIKNITNPQIFPYNYSNQINSFIDYPLEEQLPVVKNFENDVKKRVNGVAICRRMNNNAYICITQHEGISDIQQRKAYPENQDVLFPGIGTAIYLFLGKNIYHYEEISCFYIITDAVWC